jgi:hypothetical protein
LRACAAVMITAAVAFHFFMIVLQLTPLPSSPWVRDRFSAVLRVADYYRALSYANRNFRFFAPQVGPDLGLHIEFEDAAGARRAYRLPDRGREFELRIHAMLDHVADDPGSAERFAAGWARRVFAREPAAVRVVIEVAQTRLPSMQEYRRGARLSSEPVYRKSFER